MVLFEHKIQDDAIVIKKSELMTELNRLISNQLAAKAENNFDKWVYLSGQTRTIKDILQYFESSEGATDVEMGG